MPQTPVDATLGQPAAAPDPIGVEAIRQRDPQAVEAETLPGPALGHGAGGDRRGGVHEHHHKEKQHHHPRVPNRIVQKPALQTDQAVGERASHLACRIDRCTQAPTVGQHGQSRTQRGIPAGRDRAVPPIPPPDSKTVDPKAESAERVDHQVHGRRVRRILGAAQPRLDEHKPGLHEHDQEAGDQRPHIVDGVQVVDDAIIQIGRL